MVKRSNGFMSCTRAFLQVDKSSHPQSGSPEQSCDGYQLVGPANRASGCGVDDGDGDGRWSEEGDGAISAVVDWLQRVQVVIVLGLWLLLRFSSRAPTSKKDIIA